MKSKKPTVLVLGNPLVQKDRMPLKILPLLQAARPEVNFTIFEPTTGEIPHNEDIIAIDTVLGIKDAMLISSIKNLEPAAAISLHDFDFGTQLLLLNKAGLLGKVSIIGLPAKGDEKKIAKKALALLARLIPLSKGKAGQKKER